MKLLGNLVGARKIIKFDRSKCEKQTNCEPNGTTLYADQKDISDEELEAVPKSNHFNEKAGKSDEERITKLWKSFYNFVSTQTSASV